MFAVYILAIFLLPTLARVAISDDWTYIRSVEYLINRQDFYILPVAAATQITQLFWGGLFGLIFGVTPGVLRVSTLVVVLISAFALRDMLRDLSISPQRSAIAVAMYLFNPIMFAISYSFMSDPHFVAWMTISIWLYVKAEVRDRIDLIWVASAVAALAILQRPHGALIPLGVATWYLITGRLRADRDPVKTLLPVGLIPLLTVAMIYTVLSGGLPSQQGLFLSEVRAAGAGESFLLIKRMGVIEVAYIGLFILPFAIGAASAIWRTTARMSAVESRLLLVFAVLVTIGITRFWDQGRLMPYIPHFFGRGGPGSGDLRYSRRPLFEPLVFEMLTILCAAAAVCMVALLMRAVRDTERPGRSGIGMIGCLLAWQAVGAIPQSFLFRNWIISLDRYLLPMLPLVVTIAVWSVDDLDLEPLLIWPALAFVALFSIAGTRDILVFQSDVWAIARGLNKAGVADTRLDAGYAWDAYNLWEFSYANHLEPRTPDGSWWTSAYAQATDSTYVIAGAPIQGYTILSVHEISAWLKHGPEYLFVLRRTEAPPDGVIWPP